MVKRFRKLSTPQQFVVLVVGLVIALITIQVVITIIRMLIPIIIVAALILGALWLFDKTQGKKGGG